MTQGVGGPQSIVRRRSDVSHKCFVEAVDSRCPVSVQHHSNINVKMSSQLRRYSDHVSTRGGGGGVVDMCNSTAVMPSESPSGHPVLPVIEVSASVGRSECWAQKVLDKVIVTDDTGQHVLNENVTANSNTEDSIANIIAKKLSKFHSNRYIQLTTSSTMEDFSTKVKIMEFLNNLASCGVDSNEQMLKEENDFEIVHIDSKISRIHFTKQHIHNNSDTLTFLDQIASLSSGNKKDDRVCVSLSDGWLCVNGSPTNDSQFKSDSEFETFLSQFGQVESCFVVVSTVTGKQKGYGLVKYTHSSGSMRARNHLNGKSRGRLTCDWLDPNLVSYTSLQSKAMRVENLPENFRDLGLMRRMFSFYEKPPYCQIVLRRGVVQDWGLVEFFDWRDSECTLERLQSSCIKDKSIHIKFCPPGISALKIYLQAANAPEKEENHKQGLVDEAPTAKVYSQLDKLSSQNPLFANKLQSIIGEQLSVMRQGATEGGGDTSGVFESGHHSDETFRLNNNILKLNSAHQETEDIRDAVNLLISRAKQSGKRLNSAVVEALNEMVQNAPQKNDHGSMMATNSENGLFDGGGSFLSHFPQYTVIPPPPVVVPPFPSTDYHHLPDFSQPPPRLPARSTSLLSLPDLAPMIPSSSQSLLSDATTFSINGSAILSSPPLQPHDTLQNTVAAYHTLLSSLTQGGLHSSALKLPSQLQPAMFTTADILSQTNVQQHPSTDMLTNSSPPPLHHVGAFHDHSGFRLSDLGGFVPQFISTTDNLPYNPLPTSLKRKSMANMILPESPDSSPEDWGRRQQQPYTTVGHSRSLGLSHKCHGSHAVRVEGTKRLKYNTNRSYVIQNDNDMSKQSSFL